MTPREHIAFLTGSEHRVRLLRALDAPRRPCELDDEQPASRATIQRTLGGFEERGWVVKDGRTYRLTAAGDIVRQAYDEMASVVETVDETDGSLSLLSDVGLPPAAIAAATVTTASATTPHAPIERYLGAVRDADPDRFRGICPVLSVMLDEAHAAVVADGTPTDLVIDEATFEAAREHDPDGLDRAERTPSFSLYVHPEPIEFGLGILEDHVFVGAHDDRGRCRAMLDGTNRELYEWAVATFEECVGDARTVELA